MGKNIIRIEMVKRVKYQNDVFEYAVFDYLYSSLFEYAVENKLDIWTEDEFVVRPEDLDELIKLCELSMKDLLAKFYKEPSQRQISKNSARYKKINIANEEYVVDYRLDPVGREVVGISYFRNWLREHKLFFAR
ncbi:MAG: hypothetical protein HC880_13865 [Bacteroidia bacterium]|nr:hypothetical protein [Bacteroidia bacterium]